MPPPLLSRTLDPILGVFTGVFAYYLYELNPRSAIPQEDRLSELLKSRFAKARAERERKLASPGDEDLLNVIRTEVEKEK